LISVFWKRAHGPQNCWAHALRSADSINLRNATFEVDEATDVVIDRDDVHRTSLGGPQWFEEDLKPRPQPTKKRKSKKRKKR
jgi:hypothetical protein